MSQERAFCQEILETPDDDAPRLVYADWLMDHGQAERGEFIHLQCRLARMNEEDPAYDALRDRESELLARHMNDWLGFLPAGMRERVRDFHRGFPDVLRLSRAEFIAGKTRLLERSVFRGLQPRAAHAGRSGPRFPLACPQLARVTLLDLSQTGISDSQLVALAESPWLGNLTHLLLADNGIGAAGARALAAAPSLARLQVLDLRRTMIGDGGLTAIAFSTHLSNLRELLLSSLREALLGFTTSDRGRIQQAGWESLGRSRTLTNLRRLDIGGIPLLSSGMAELTAAPWLGSLRDLELRHCHVETQGLQALAATPALGGLERLGLSGNSLSDDGAAILARSPHLSRLRSIDLGSNNLTAKGIAVLVNSPSLTALADLDLRLNALDEAELSELLRQPGWQRIITLKWGLSYQSAPAAIRRICSSPHLVGLRSLTLSDLPLGEEGAAMLFRSSLFEQLSHLDLTRNRIRNSAATLAAVQAPRLRTLNLSDNHIGDEGLKAMAKPRDLTSLVRLFLERNAIGSAGVAALVGSTALPNVRELSLAGNPIGDGGVSAPAHSPFLGQLHRLNLRTVGLTDEGAAGLVSSPHTTRLRHLDVAYNSLTAATRKLLRQRFGGRVLIDDHAL